MKEITSNAFLRLSFYSQSLSKEIRSLLSIDVPNFGKEWEDVLSLCHGDLRGRSRDDD